MKRIAYRAIAAGLMIAVLLAGLSVTATGANAATENNLLKVTGASWYSPGSAGLAVPGTDYVPLFISFVALFNSTGGSVLNVSANLTAQFSYSNVTGGQAKTTLQLAPVTQGSEYTLIQMVNISAAAANGLYTEQLAYSVFNSTGTVLSGNSAFTLPLLGSVNLVSAGAAFGTSANPIQGTPGMKYIPLSVFVENTGNSAVTNISVQYAPSGHLYGQVQTTYVSAMQAFGFATLTFVVSIDSTTPLGLVQQSLLLSYNSADHPLNFSVPVTGYSNISVINYFTNPPAVFQNEKYIQLTVYTANAGNSFAANLTVSASSSHFDILTAPYLLPAYPAGRQLNFTFLMNALNYTGPARVTVSIGNSAYSIPLYLKPEGTLDISSAVPVFNPGNSNQLISFTVTNGGNLTLWNLNMHLLSPGIISIHIPSSNPFAALTADNVTFAELQPGQTLTVTFLMDTSSSAAVGTYTAQLFISWMHNDSSSVFYKAYSFSEVVQKSSVQRFTEAFALTPLNGAVLAVIVIAVIVLAVAGLRRSRGRKKEGKVAQRKLAGEHARDELEDGKK